MLHTPAATSLDRLMAVIAEQFVTHVGPDLDVIGAPLPGKAVCAVAKPGEDWDGITRIVYDPNKPRALEHLQEMVRSHYGTALTLPCPQRWPCPELAVL